MPLLIERKRGETQLLAKEVTVEGRYIVCRNEAEAEKDRRDRQAIVGALQDALRRGEKVLIGNAAYRRYLRKRSVVWAFEIDVGKLAEEARWHIRVAHQRRRDTTAGRTALPLVVAG